MQPLTTANSAIGILDLVAGEVRVYRRLKYDEDDEDATMSSPTWFGSLRPKYRHPCGARGPLGLSLNLIGDHDALLRLGSPEQS
ncbi:hypothetical protein LINGRAHAP2_LOCUS28655 [Linum grandiflorum]